MTAASHVLERWQEVAPGVWRATVGQPEALSPRALLSAAGVRPRHDALAHLPSAPFPLPLGQVSAEVTSHRTVFRLPLDPEEKLLGLGLQLFTVNHRGRTRYLRVNSDPRQDTGETHAPVPFYVSTRGYGVFVDTARIVTFYGGSCVRRGEVVEVRDRNSDRQWRATPPSRWVELVLGAPGAELYVLAGPTVLDVVCRYNLFWGGGVLPPRWGLGFWHRTPSLADAQQVLAEAREYRRRDFPCDVIGLEPGWQSRSYPCTYVWSSERFPEPASLVSTLREEGFRVNLWEHPYVSPESPIYRELEPLSGSHTVWGGLVPDFTLSEVQEAYMALHQREHVSIGVAGYKIDECDGSELTRHSWMFPAHASFPSGNDGEQMRQVYGLLLQTMAAKLFRQNNRRTYGLVRASGLGASSLPFVLYTDLYDLRQFVRALCNASLCGLLFTPEVRSARSAEEWVRRLQIVCFSPLAQLNAWSSGTKPWSFPEVEDMVRHFIQLRMRLLPYFHAAFARYQAQGLPPFRAMALEWPELAEVDDQYMAGDALLVAPLFPGQTEREVVLPPGRWYDFDTGQAFAGNRRIAVAGGLERLPLFVREGGLIPLMPPLPHAPGLGAAVPLEVRHYGQQPARLLLPDDDDETSVAAPERQGSLILAVDVLADGTRCGRVEVQGVPGGTYGPVTWQFLG